MARTNVLKVSKDEKFRICESNAGNYTVQENKGGRWCVKEYMYLNGRPVTIQMQLEHYMNKYGFKEVLS